MRPDVAAFRELDTLVRNLTEQLAGYRRRAITGEARARDLEDRVAGLTDTVSAVRAELEAAQEAKDHALAAARESTTALKTALVDLEQRKQEAAARAAAAVDAVPPSAEVLAENEQLRGRVADAKVRTAQIADRVRFLRQQVAQGVEK